MRPLVSVIVPIYNVEEYLNTCVDSIINQTYKNIEIILVDDGSPDNCGKICDEYACKDSRVKVIHKKNGGLSDARNAGIDVANGEYLIFVDSDDWIISDMCEILVNNLANNLVDIVACNQYETFNRNFDNIVSNYECRIFNNEEALKKYLNGQFFYTSTCGRLYKKELFKNIRFPLNRKAEDLFTTYKLLYSANKIIHVNFIGYVYCRRDNSIMATTDVKLIKDIFSATKKEFEFLSENLSSLKIDITRIYMRCLLKTYSYFSRNEFSDNDEIKELKKKIDNIIRKNKCLQTDNVTNLMVNIYCFSPWMIVKILKLLKKDR